MNLDNFGADVGAAEAGFSEPKPAIENKPFNDKGLMPLGLHGGISNEDYHKGAGISSSSLKNMMRCPAYYHAAQTGVVKFKETPAMALGTAVHKLVLEPDDFDSEIVVAKTFGRKKVDLEAKADFMAANAGKTIITKEQYDNCQAMRDSIMALPEAELIFRTGQAEQSGYYIDKKTGMLCKYRPDWRTDWALFDIKTTRDARPEKFSRTIHELGYHVSAAHYLAGDAVTKSTEHDQFIFLCVEPEPPYLAVPYVLDAKSLELGHFKRRRALDMIKHCRETKEWPTYNAGECQEISVPQYAMYDLEKSKI